VAEGVETPQQLAFLQSENCDLLQGFHFRPPLPQSEFLAFLKGYQADRKKLDSEEE